MGMKGCLPKRVISEFQTLVDGSVGTDPQEIPTLHAILQVFKYSLNVIFAYWE